MLLEGAPVLAAALHITTRGAAQNSNTFPLPSPKRWVYPRQIVPAFVTRRSHTKEVYRVVLPLMTSFLVIRKLTDQITLIPASTIREGLVQQVRLGYCLIQQVQCRITTNLFCPQLAAHSPGSIVRVPS